MTPMTRRGLLLDQHRELFGTVPTTVIYGDIEDLCEKLEQAIKSGEPLTDEKLYGHPFPEGVVI